MGKLRQILAAEGLIRTALRKGDIVQYKGKSYRLLWSGPTRYGDRAKLEFMDGSKQFWVDLSKVSAGGGGGGRSRGRGRGRGYWGDRCRGCRGQIKDAPHHPAMEGYCGYCAFDEFDM